MKETTKRLMLYRTFYGKHLESNELSHGAKCAAGIKINVIYNKIFRFWKQSKKSKISNNEIYNINSK